MPLTVEQFAKELGSMVSKRKAFWEHPWVQKFRRAELSKEQIAAEPNGNLAPLLEASVAEG